MVPIESEPEIEDVLRHDVHDDSLVVSDLVLQVDDPLILKVSLQHLTQLINFVLEGLLIAKVLIMPKLLLNILILFELIDGLACSTGIDHLPHCKL